MQENLAGLLILWFGRLGMEEAVTWQEMTSRDRKWPLVTRKWRQCLKGWRLLKTRVLVCFGFYRAVTCRRWQSHDRKWCHVTGSDLWWPGSDVIWLEVASKGLEKAKNSLFGCVSAPTGLYIKPRDSGQWASHLSTYDYTLYHTSR